MEHKLDELTQIIHEFDKLLDYWFGGVNASLLSAGGEKVYETADHCRNRALEIIEELRSKL